MSYEDWLKKQIKRLRERELELYREMDDLKGLTFLRKQRHELKLRIASCVEQRLALTMALNKYLELGGK